MGGKGEVWGRGWEGRRRGGGGDGREGGGVRLLLMMYVCLFV